MTQEPSPTNTTRDGNVTYQPASSGAPGRVLIDINISQENRRQRLLHDTTHHLDGDIYDAAASIDAVATRHLQELTGTNSQLVWDGDVVRVAVDLHAPSTAQQPALSAEQTNLATNLTEAVAEVLPPQERHRAEAVALQAAAQLPSPAQAITAYERTTLNQVLDYARNGTAPFAEPSLPAALRTAQLSFPSHPSAALQSSAGQPASTQAGRPISAVKSTNTLDR